MTHQHRFIDSPIGPLTLVGTDDALSGLYMQGHSHPPSPKVLGPRTQTGFDAAIAQLDEYFAGARREFALPLGLHGTSFQLRVWELLRQIPFGETRSYTDLSHQLGNPAAIRALAAANGRNPVSIIVPCHRVIGADGSLVGYAGGLERKRFLLELEGALEPEPTLF